MMSARLKVSCTKKVCVKSAFSRGSRLLITVATSFLTSCKDKHVGYRDSDMNS